MSNNWKYSTLGQRERLAMIKKGDTDVYNTEKANNKRLKEERAALGLSTSDIDNWENIIDSAVRAQNNRFKVKPNGLPKFMNGREGKVNSEYRAYNDQLRKNADRKIMEAFEKAENDLNYLDEFLAGNGYSFDGHAYKTGHEKITKELADTVDAIENEYKTKDKDARKRFLAQLDSLVKQAKK